MKLLLIFAVFVPIAFGEGQEYYVSSDNATVSCLGRPCYSLQYYCNNYQEFFVDNTTFFFMEGTHWLDKSHLVLIEGISNITLQGMNYSLEEGSHETVRQPTVFIDCNYSNSGFVLYNCSKVSIIGITFVNCGGLMPDNITKNILPMQTSSYQYSLTDGFVALGIINTKLITLHEISIQKSVDLGLMCINALNVSITNSSFAYNNLANYTNCTKINSCSGGNALFIYTPMEQCQNYFYIYYTNITYSNFSFGFDNSLRKPPSASGLTILLVQGDHYGVNVTMKNLILFGNSGIASGNFYYLASEYVAYQSLFISNCTSMYGNAIHLLERNNLFDFIEGSVFSMYLCLPAYTSSIEKCFESLTIFLPKIPVIIIQHSQFIHNTGPNGAGLTFYGLGLYQCRINQPIIIQSCQIVNNSGFSGASLNIFSVNTVIVIINVSIIKSQMSYRYSSISNSQLKSAILIEEIMNIVFVNVTVADNSLSGMMISDSTVAFVGYNLFINNKAEDGAGLFINEKSVVGLGLPVQLVFENNTALGKGGAIYVNINPLLSRNKCFMQPYFLNFQNYTSVIFKNNDAMIAGSAMYGGFIDTCHLMIDNDTEYSIVNGSVWSESIFHFINQTGLSVISSDPEKICFCRDNGIINCALKSLNFSLLPGQFQNINLVTVGQREGVSPGVITISEQIQGGPVRQSYESTKTNCTSIKYYPHVNVSMASSLQVVTLSLQEQDPHTKYIFFNIDECPLGFELSPVTGSCDCISYLKTNESLTCDAHSESFYHQGGMWIGYVEESRCFISKLSCKSQHCKMSPVNFTLSTTEKQCDLNRSGLLCGDCDEGLSMMLGSDSCGECSDGWLALLILFAVAGIVLIVFITALNLTVSVGSINGLIFYANMVKMNEFLIPSRSYFFQVFISWLNLDWGIKMCFYNGMTTLHKMLLQFLFPAYLWLLIILVIILSHYSFKVSRLIGRHAISVLATVLLLSFTKILRLCNHAILPITYTCEPGSQNINENHAWAMDARILYWSQKHLFLLIPALATLILVVLPYTLLILCSPLVERYISKYKCCQCWVKLKPLFDAYNGPYNDKYRSWTGFLLLKRCLLVTIFATKDPNISIMALIIVSGFLLSLIGIFNGIYQRKINNFLECFFLFNLSFLATSYLVSDSSAYILSSISLSLAFVAFILIVLCHLGQTKLFKKVKDYLQKKSKLRKNQLPSNIPMHMLHIKLLGDNRHVKIEDASSLELYKEDGSFVLRKRESLISDENNEIWQVY